MTLLEAAVEALKNVNARDIRIYETKDNNPFFSYTVVGTSIASRQMEGLVSQMYDIASKEGFAIRGVEGRGGAGWLLIDLNDVVVNLFTLEERDRFEIDKLYAMLPQIDINKL